MSYQIFSSEKVALATEIELDISAQFAHSFAGIRYFNAADVQVVPTAGTVKVQSKHLTNNHYDDVNNATLKALEPGKEADWGGNATKVKATATGVTGSGVATYQLVVVQNLS